MNMKKFLIIIFFFSMLFVEAQDIPTMPTRNYQIIPQTPTTSQFLRYDEQPISEYTGIPNISIPIYNIQVDELSIPLNLTYHAGGIKVNQDASWVGLGWDLPLYSIIQTINDLDDLSTAETKMLPDWIPTPSSSNYQYPYYPIKHEDLGLSGYSYRGFPQVDLPQPNSSAVDMKHYYWISPRWYFAVNGVRKGWEKLFSDQFQFGVDSEPDIFKITLPGASLNVIMDFRYGGFIVLNKKGYKVSRSGNTWKVINPDGIEFYFTDKTETVTESNSNVATSPPKTTMKTWMINRIVTPKGKEVNVNYSKTINTYNNIVKTQSKDESLNLNVSQVPSSSISHSSIDMTTTYSLVTNTTTTKEYQLYPSSIAFPEGTVYFSTSDRQDLSVLKKLDEVKINDKSNNTVKSIKFNYNYFPEKNVTSKRLKLLSVTENNELTHSFTYNTTVLPPKNSFEQDYWGYPNGYSANTSLLPNPARFKTEYSNKNNGNNLSANLTHTKSAVLEKIKYPTGGTVTFDYELNEFNNYWVPDIDSLNNKISKGYGLRVKLITHNDGANNVKQTVYQYGEGIAILKNSTIEKFSRQFVRRISGNYDQIQKDDILSLNVGGFYSSNPLSSFNSVGYGKVVKLNTDKNSNDKGKTATYYHNNVDITPKQPSSGINMVTFISTPAFKNSNVPENGMIKLIQYYNDNNKLIQETSYEYNNMLSQLYYGARVSSYANHVISDLGDFGNPSRLAYIPLHTVGLYPIFDFESLLTKKIEKTYKDSEAVEIVSTYAYNSYGALSGISVVNSKDRLEHHNFKYPTDFSTTDIYKTMVSKNVLSPVIKESFYTYNGISKKEITTNYAVQASGLILPSSLQSSSFGSSNIRTDLTFDHYDTKGNILQTTTLAGFTTIYLWSYNYQYAIAEIKGVTYEQIENILGVTLINRLANALIPTDADLKIINDLRKNTTILKDAHVTTYTYKPLVGILTATDPSGITTYYDYDSFGRLKETYIMENGVKKVVQSYDYHYQNQ